MKKYKKAPKIWAEIRSAYRKGEGSLRDLAERFGVAQSSIERRAIEEGWVEQREEVQKRAETKAKEIEANSIAAMIAGHRLKAAHGLDRVSELLSDERLTATQLAALMQALQTGIRAERLSAGIDPDRPLSDGSDSGRPKRVQIIVERDGSFSESEVPDEPEPGP